MLYVYVHLIRGSGQISAQVVSFDWATTVAAPKIAEEAVAGAREGAERPIVQGLYIGLLRASRKAAATEAELNSWPAASAINLLGHPVGLRWFGTR